MVAWLAAGSAAGAQRASAGAPPDRGAAPVYLLVRSDDAGMSHSVNMALKQLIESGLPVSVSVMFATPWYQETVEILRQHPAVSVGVHLTLNSEWKGLRWGPVLGSAGVPSLVDANGHFFPSGELLKANNPQPAEVERELRAQLDRARRSGLRVDYVDYHMGTALRFPEFRDVTEKLAREYGLGMSQYFGETMHWPHYAAPPAQKLDTLVALVGRLTPGVHALVTHVGLDDAELGALVDMNSEDPLADMSANRQAELNALTAPRLRDAMKSRNIQLITYRQLIEMQGLQSMRRPGG